jgi:protein disulfide-isomerase A1
MRNNFIAILLISLFIASYVSSTEEDQGVLILDESNFDEAITTYKYLLVKFYAPNCIHCKNLAPEYIKAAQTLRNNDPEVYLAKVDATKNKNLGNRFNIQGFPTLKLFMNGTPIEYDGGRKECDIVNWMVKKTGPSVKFLNSVQDVEKLISTNEAVVILFDEANETFTKVADSFDGIVFATCSSIECIGHWMVNKGNISLFKKFDEGRNDYSGTQSIEYLTEWVKVNATPSSMSFDEKSAQIVFGKNTPAIFLYRDKTSEKAKQLETIFKTAAHQLKGTLQFIITDIKDGLETRLAEYIGIKSSDLPTVRIHDTRQDLKKYNLEGEISVESVLKFINDWEKGNLKPHLKSEEIPTSQDEAVYVLVGKSFEKVVMDPQNDVLVEFYAPWCKHCKDLAPIYETVAKDYLYRRRNLIIAKIDATANEVENVNIQGFPTIKFWPANDKTNPIDFGEERTAEDLIKFIEKYSSPASRLNEGDL